MRRFAYPALAMIAFTVSLAACGPARTGGSSSHSDASSSASATPASSGELPPGAIATGPGTTRIGRFTEVFGTPLPSDQRTRAVAASFQRAMLLWDDSQEKGTLVAPVTSYVTGRTLAVLKFTIRTFKQQNLVPSGTDHLFRTAVTAGTDRATVTSCANDSKYTEVNPETGVPDPAFKQQSLNEQYPEISWTLVPHAGHWALSAVRTIAPTSNDGPTPCLPHHS